MAIILATYLIIATVVIYESSDYMTKKQVAVMALLWPLCVVLVIAMLFVLLVGPLIVWIRERK